MLSLPCLMHLNSVFFAEVGASVAHHSFFLRQRLGHLSVIVSPSLFQGEPNCIGQSIPTSLLFSPRFPHRYFMDPLLDSILLTFSWCNFCNLIPQTFISFVQSVSVSFMSNFLSKLIGRASSQATLGHRMGDDLIRGVTSLLDVVGSTKQRHFRDSQMLVIYSGTHHSVCSSRYMKDIWAHTVLPARYIPTTIQVPT